MKATIIGLPQSGKTTLFHAVAGPNAAAEGHGGEEILRAVVRVPDERLDRLSEMFKPKKTTPATIEVEDVGPLFEDRGGSRVVRAAALAEVRDADGLVVNLRAFENPAAMEKGVDVRRDAQNMGDELLLADLGQIEKRLERLEKDIKRPTEHQQRDKQEYDILLAAREAIEDGRAIGSLALSAEQEKLIRSFAFLSLKPVICTLNMPEGQSPEAGLVSALSEQFEEVIAVSAQIEKEIEELDPEDRALFMEEAGIEEPASPRLLQACYRALRLASFFTVGEDECRAWTIHRGDDAVTAASKVHTDIARGFIRAEVVGYEEFMEAGSLKEAKNRGQLRLEGKDYIVRDGDIINFRFNV